MPEGIEVRKFCDILRANVLNHQITKITIKKGRYTKKAFDGYTDLVAALPVTLTAITNKGKFTYLTLNSPSKGKIFYLLATLGMGGGWTILKKNKDDFTTTQQIQGRTRQIDIKYAKRDEGYYSYPYLLEYVTNNSMEGWFKVVLNNLSVEFEIDDGSKMYFYDNRNFGTLKSVDDKAVIDKKLREIGPDMMDISFDDFKKAIEGKKTNSQKEIGNVIVNQKLVSGIGNYLRADILWMAKISPFRKVADVSEEELRSIYNSARVLMWGDYDYQYAKDAGIITRGVKIPRDYGRDFLVYMQDTDPDGEKVKKEPLFEGSAKRFIHWVPTVQK